jgi:shikimate kinase
MNGSHTPSGGLVLVGARGTGKSSVGQLLAGLCGRPFVDTDSEVVRLAGGQPISALFERFGEPRFRALEAQALEGATREPGKVIATGGGIVLSESNRALLKRYGFVVWLTGRALVLGRRLAADPRSLAERPALTAAGTLEEIAAVLAARAPLYQQVADAVVDTTDLTIPEAAQLAHAAWRALSDSKD